MFDTAIFYDIENLIGGYGNKNLLKPKLKDILDQIKERNIGKIAIQKAYGNWINQQLIDFRHEITLLGIEPIQMFGFGKGSQTNACDIQLCIDAMETLFCKKEIKNFVIVSGDGGFSYLAKKLHEYGKNVIACAYNKSINKILELNVDDFICIPGPIIKTEEVKIFDNPILNEFAKNNNQIKNITQLKKEEVLDKINEIFIFLNKNDLSLKALNTKGLNISIFSEILNYFIKDFSYKLIGFSNLLDLIKYFCLKSNCKLIFKSPSEYRLLNINKTLNGYEEVKTVLEKQ